MCTCATCSICYICLTHVIRTTAYYCFCLQKLSQQEQTNTRLNSKLILNLHRKIMRTEKIDQLRKEIELLAQNHERDMDRKDAIIRSLIADLTDSEEQFQTAQRTHMQRMSTLGQLHGSKLSTLESEFERDLKQLKYEFLTER